MSSVPNIELAVRLDLSEKQRLILADYIVFRKGKQLVRCPDSEGHVVTVKARHTKVCDRCGVTLFAYLRSQHVVCHDCYINEPTRCVRQV